MFHLPILDQSKGDKEKFVLLQLASHVLIVDLRSNADSATSLRCYVLLRFSTR